MIEPKYISSPHWGTGDVVSKIGRGVSVCAAVDMTTFVVSGNNVVVESDVTGEPGVVSIISGAPVVVVVWTVSIGISGVATGPWLVGTGTDVSIGSTVVVGRAAVVGLA